MAVDYKQKYLDLRSKFAKTTDRYYRTGYEAGMKEGQMAAQQEQMQMQQQQEMMEQGIDPETGQPIEGGPQIDPETGEPIEGGGEQMDPAMMEEGMEGEEGGSELDQHINELESLVAKGEKPKVTDLRKAIQALSNVRKNNKNQLKSNHKEVTVSKQKNLVDNMLKKWESESKESVMDNLEEIVNKEGIKLD